MLLIWVSIDGENIIIVRGNVNKFRAFVSVQSRRGFFYGKKFTFQVRDFEFLFRIFFQRFLGGMILSFFGWVFLNRYFLVEFQEFIETGLLGDLMVFEKCILEWSKGVFFEDGFLWCGCCSGDFWLIGLSFIGVYGFCLISIQVIECRKEGFVVLIRIFFVFADFEVRIQFRGFVRQQVFGEQYQIFGFLCIFVLIFRFSFCRRGRVENRIY